MQFGNRPISNLYYILKSNPSSNRNEITAHLATRFGFLTNTKCRSYSHYSISSLRPRINLLYSYHSRSYSIDNNQTLTKNIDFSNHDIFGQKSSFPKPQAKPFFINTANKNQGSNQSKFKIKTNQTPLKQEEIIQRVYRIDQLARQKWNKRSQASQKSNRHNNIDHEIHTKHTTTPTFSKLPEKEIYYYKPNKALLLMSAICCVGSFPLHIWGLLTLTNPVLVMPYLSGSLLWLWWHWRTMNSTLIGLCLLEGHELARITSMGFWSFQKNRIVPVSSLTSGVNRVKPKPISKSNPPDLNLPLCQVMGSIEIGYIEVCENQIKNTDKIVVYDLKKEKNNQSPTIQKRTRYVVNTQNALIMQLSEFLKFTNTPATNPLSGIRHLLSDN